MTEPIKGRGAQSANVPQRFGLSARQADGDWRDMREALDGPAPRLRTSVFEERPKSVLTYNTSPDLGFDRSVNAYRGCEHGCIYCFARPTHAYHDLSPGLDFETKLFAKPNAGELLRKALGRKGYKPQPIALGTNTDPYQPIERRYRITRDVLEICLETRHPVVITTKSDRVLDDLDLLGDLAKLNLVAVALSVTTLDPLLSGSLEPRAASPAKRLVALRRLAESGIKAHCSIAPVIPGITDQNMERIVEEASKAGARSASWLLLRLPHEVAPLFREWLQVHFPDRADKVMSIVRQSRGGRDNDPKFFSRMRPRGVWADLFRQRFRLACRRASLDNSRFDLDASKFHPPPAQSSIDAQLSLL